MRMLKPRYIVNERNEPVEVILDLATFRKIEELLEDHLFGQILQEAATGEPLSLEEAKREYKRLIKKPSKKRQ